VFSLFRREKLQGINRFERDVLQKWEVPQSNHAERLRMRLAFASAAAAYIQSISVVNNNKAVDKIYNDVANTSKDLDIVIEDLFDVNIPDHSIEFSMRDFMRTINQRSLKVDKNTMINGLAAIDALFATFGKASASWVLERANGPLGISGSAAILIQNLVFGDRPNTANIIETAFHFTQIIDEDYIK